MANLEFDINQYKYVEEKYVTLHANYVITQKIGEGAYGCVYEAASKLDSRKYAIKRVDLTKRKNRGNMLEPQNLVFIDEMMSNAYKEKFYYHSWSENNCLFIKMRLMKGNITNLYGELNFSNESVFIDFFLQITKFLSLLHDNNYVHLDIKPGNLKSQHTLLSKAEEA